MNNGSSTTRMPNSDSGMDAVLDRMVASHTASVNPQNSSASGEPLPSFLASATWQGAKPGYYFGTSREGIGYYRDHNNKQSNHNGNGSDSVPTKPSRKRSRQEASTAALSADELLQQAEQAVDPHSKVIDLTPKGVRNAAKSLEKSVARNALQRAQHADSPEQYMESELALHEQISTLSAIAADATSLFPTVLQEGTILSQLAQLLSHDNNDIALSVVRVLVEWLDVDSSSLSDEPTLLMVHAVVEECLEGIVANLGRLDPQQEEDANGIEAILTLLESLLDMDGDGSVAVRLVQKTMILGWLLSEISLRESGRALEVLVVLLQQPKVHEIQSDLTKVAKYASLMAEDSVAATGEDVDGIEILLLAMAKYRKTQPQTEAECDFLENTCLALASAVTFSSTNVDNFLEAQGIELVTRCWKEKVHAGGVGLKLLDFRSSRKACEHIVAQAGCLKYLFPLFLGRSIPRPAPASGRTSAKTRKEWLRMLEIQVIHILYNLTRYLTDDSPEDAKERLLVKFLEDDCEKCDRLVELLLQYDHKARSAEYKFYRSDVEEEMNGAEVELAALDAKLKGGGDLFHRLGAIAAFVCVGSRKGHNHILEQLALQQSGIGVIKASVQEFASILDDGEQKTQLHHYISLI